jgi:ArsR family transcriptional regulator, arsenate/arsenite/antimonite-responsive transcriptional repressor
VTMKEAAIKPPIETVFRALSDRTRLRILNLLRAGELCVCDLVSVLDIPQPAASRHLSYLRRASLVAARREGPWMFYCLAPARSMFQQKVLDCVPCCGQEDAAFVDDVKRLKAQRRSNCCR